MTARGIMAGIILMTVIANGGIATTEIEFRNDNILTIELKKCVRQQLPELGDAKVVALANHLVDSLGVGEMDDLIHVGEYDLIEHLKPIQIRKLLEGMKACGSDKKVFGLRLLELLEGLVLHMLGLVHEGVVAGLQSAGAAGIGAATTSVLAATGATVAGGTAYKVLEDGDTEEVNEDATEE